MRWRRSFRRTRSPTTRSSSRPTSWPRTATPRGRFPGWIASQSAIRRGTSWARRSSRPSGSGTVRVTSRPRSPRSRPWNRRAHRPRRATTSSGRGTGAPGPWTRPSAPTRPWRVAAQLAALPPAATPTELEAGTLLEDPHFLAGAELLRLGFNEAASSELLAARRTGQPPEAQHLLVEAVARTGDVRSAHGVARLALRRELSGPVAPASRELWAIAYPDAFRDLVVRYTKGSPVEPELLQALMREESALDPRALSWAGAVGLTQLMLPTAREVARGLRLRPPSAEQLQNPSTNIQLGAAYLARLLQRFDGNVALALAGYNAGEGAVTRWRSARPETELDRWVEEIPLSETRGYVKRVLRSWNSYRLLGGRPLPGVLKTSVPAAPRAERER